MGDSHTYGTHVRREEAWPSRLQAASGRKTYNISCGSWSPTQSLILLDRALALHPRLVIEAFYAGNDFYDSFATVYVRRQLPELKSSDPRVAEAIRAAESREPLETRYAKLYDRLLGGGTMEAEQRERNLTRGLRGFMREHFQLYRLARVVKKSVTERPSPPPSWEEEKRNAEQGDGPELLRVADSDSARAIFTPVFRTEGMNLEDPRLVEGYRICLEAIVRIGQRVRASGADYLVLLVPTKEQVFCESVPPALQSDPVFRRAVEDAQEIRRRTKAFLDDRGIPYLDPLPALRESLARGEPPYPRSMDGHPNPTGHRVIARYVLGELERRGLPRAPAAAGSR
jgi:lysophospholipase L1-like esterase